MGAGCAFSVAGSNSYDLQMQRKQTNGGNLEGREEQSTVQEKASEQNQPLVGDIPEERSRENPDSTNLGIVSQSHCEVNFTQDYGLDSNVEKSQTVVSDKESKENSTLVIPSEKQRNEFIVQERLVSDGNFTAGHVTRVVVEKQTAGHVKSSGNDELLNVLSRASDEDIQRVVDKCWQDIEDSCNSQHNCKSSPSIDSSKGWRVVRLFVSSTFADYHAEREILVKKVCYFMTQSPYEKC